MYKYLANTLFTGKKIVYLPTCHSTNDLARQFVQQKQVIEGTIIITDEQTAGKGQRGNKWITEPGENLTFSIIYQPVFLNAEDSFYLNIIVSLGILKALSDLNIQVEVKWPNDIYYKNKKIGGILIENTLDQKKISYAIIGIGLNINQNNFNIDTASSLKNITGKNYNLELLLNAVAQGLEQYYLQLKSGKREYLRNLYLSNLLGLNQIRKFNRSGEITEGTIKGVDPLGRLKLEIAGQIEYFSFKEISFIME